MEVRNIERIYETIKDLLDTKESMGVDTITLRDLIKFTEIEYDIRNKKANEILSAIKKKFKNSIKIACIDNEICLFIQHMYEDDEEIVISVNNNDMVVVEGNSKYKNLMQLIGEDLNSYYYNIYTNKDFIKNYNIDGENFKIKFVLDEIDRSKTKISLTIGNLYKCEIVKIFSKDVYEVNCDSYKVTKFIEENLDCLLENIRIPKSLCPKISESYFKELEEDANKKEKIYESQKQDGRKLIKSILRKK